MIIAWQTDYSEYPPSDDSIPTRGDVDYCNAYAIREGEQTEHLGIQCLCDPSEGTGWVRRMLRMDE